jgi:uncharacterized protein (DUF1800 family)
MRGYGMSGRHVVLTMGLAAFAAQGASVGDDPAGRFETKLSSEQRIQHVLNRLTFGARARDVEEVRKLGVEKWIELQLHPERIPENPALDTKLEPLETLHMQAADILKQYFPQFPPGTIRPENLNELLAGDQMRKVLNGTAEERKAAILALDPEKRIKVLATVGPNVVEDLPDLKKEQEQARKKRQEEQQKEMLRLRPPLSDLLDPEQVKIAQHGTRAERSTLFAALDPGKLQKVSAALPMEAVADEPGLRRMGQVLRQPREVPLDDLREARLYRAIYSNRQLEEVLTDFWLNHFNVFEAKGPEFRAMLASYEQEAIRPNVLGKFKDLLLAVAHHPAMLYYLDNWESMSGDVFQIGPFAQGGTANGVPPFARQSHGLNENYGRELMELHTLGVNGGYTQEDVINVARCFTGWTIRQVNEKPEFAFAAFMHDTDEKTVLGHKIPRGGGEQDGLEVIDILARHPSTARYISTKLARRFVADDPPAALIDRMARTFLKTDGDLRAVLEVLFTSREFFSEGALQSKLKSPLEMVASAARALDADAVDTFALAQRVADMGEPLYGKEPPTGYKDTADAWLSTANVVARINFVNALANNRVAGVHVDISRFGGNDFEATARRLLNREPSKETLTAIGIGLQGKQPPNAALVVSLVLSSPDFQRR